MTELEQLIEQRKKIVAQRREIEEKIEQIKRNQLSFGCAKFERVEHEYSHRVEWKVMVRTGRFNGKEHVRYIPVVSEPTKEEAIDELKKALHDLTELLEMIEKE